MLQRLDAFRELIRHGHALLGEVVTYCRQAEAAVAELAAEKQAVDRIRPELEQARLRAEAEAQGARTALAQTEAQRAELADMRTALLAARSEMEQVQRAGLGRVESLEGSLREAREQQLRLEQELQRVRGQLVSSRNLDARLEQVDAIEARLRATEKELVETRTALDQERSRRNRAIALIKPKLPGAAPAAPEREGERP